MTWRDKLEIGLKEDAPYRKDNLPEQEVRGPEIPAGPERSPIVPAAIDDVNEVPPQTSGTSDERAEGRKDHGEFSEAEEDRKTGEPANWARREAPLGDSTRATTPDAGRKAAPSKRR
jgi:hypothetical protein